MFSLRRFYIVSVEIPNTSRSARQIPITCSQGRLPKAWTGAAKSDGGGGGVEILAGFPEKISARVLYLSADNLNTDGIYAGKWTYKDDLTPEQMAEVTFENYDPRFNEIYRAGDVVVGGRNFGTGSSREQAATSLAHKGVPCVIAASFSQTYKRNAFNNGFPCVTCPELLGRVRELMAKQAEAGEKTIIPGDEIEIDFAKGTTTFRANTFRFPPLSGVPQALVVAGGIENQVRQQLGLSEPE